MKDYDRPGRDAVTETKFVGQSRRQLVDHLVEQFYKCQTGGRAHWVSLEGPSGWGKTRVIQEFYKAVSAAQISPAYWPPKIHASGDDNQEAAKLDVSRKLVTPRFRHVPGALPSYIWWGTSCSSRNGTASDALAQDFKEFEVHASYYDDALLDKSGVAARVSSSLGAGAKQVADDSANSILDAGLDDILVPGASLLKGIGSRTWGGMMAARVRRDRLKNDDLIEPSMDLVDESFAIISKTIGRTLPMIMVVDDFHRIDEGLSRLLGKLLSLNQPLLIITTALPGLLEDNVMAWDLVEAWWQERLDRVLHTDEVGSLGGLDLLALEDRMSLVRDFYPTSPAESQELIALRYKNPLAIALFCGIDRVRRQFASLGELSVSFVADSPMTVTDLYRALWLDLPPDVRAVLSLAARSIPSTIDVDWGRSNRWHTSILKSSLSQFFTSANSHEMPFNISDDTRFAWTRQISHVLREFAEADEQHVAAQDDEWAGDTETKEFLNIVAANVDKHDFSDEDVFESPSQDDIHVAWLAFALSGARIAVSDQALTSSALILLAHLDVYPSELAMKIKIGQYALATCQSSPPGSALIRLQLGEALHEAGRIDDAQRTFVALIADHQLNRVALSDDDYLWLQLQACINTLKMGKSAEALVGFEALVERTATLKDSKADRRFHTRVRIHYADALSQTGQYNEAVTLLRELLEHTVLSETDGAYFSVMSMMAGALQTAGRFPEAIPIHRQLVVDVEGQYGKDAPFTLAVRNNLATALHKGDDDLDEAIDIFNDVARRRNIVLGPAHPASMVVRNNRANALKDAGKMDAAQDELERLIVDQERLLGTHHPSSLLAKHNLALLLEERGRGATALALFREVLEHREHVLSPNHLSIFISKFTLARSLASLKKFGEARVIYIDLLESQRNVLGDSDRDTILTWRHAIDALVECRHYASALRLTRELVEVMRANFGTNDKLTLVVEAEYALVLAAVGEIQEGSRRIASVRARTVHSLGPNHDLIVQIDRIAKSISGHSVALFRSQRPKSAFGRI